MNGKAGLDELILTGRGGEAWVDRNKIVLAVVAVIVLVGLVGCGNSEPAVVLKVRDDILVYVSEDSHVGELYLVGENEERQKIASDMWEESFELLSDAAILYVDKKDVLHYWKSDGERTTVTKEVVPWSVQVSGDESTFAYLKGEDRALYIQELKEGALGERVRVASRVNETDYTLSHDGNTLAYIGSDSNLYVKQGTEPETRIASNVSCFVLYPEGQVMWYLTQDRELYTRKLDEDDNVKINCSDASRPNLAGNNIAYLADFDHAQDKGELYVVRDRRTPEWLASDVAQYWLVDNGKKLYFINSDDKLFYRDLAAEKNTLVASEVSEFMLGGERSRLLVYRTKDASLYAGNPDGENKRLTADVVDYKLTAPGLVYYLNDDDELYAYDFRAEPVLVASDVEGLEISDNLSAVAYYNSKNEAYVITDRTEGKQMIRDVEKYSKVYISNRLLFANLLDLKDLVGTWELDSEWDRVFLEFTNDGRIRVFAPFTDDEDELAVEVTGFTETTGLAVTQYGEAHVEKVNENEIVIDGDLFTRITPEQVESAKELSAAEALCNELYYSRIVVPEGTELKREPSVESEVVGVTTVQDEWHVYDTKIDDEINIWLRITDWVNDGWIMYEK